MRGRQASEVDMAPVRSWERDEGLGFRMRTGFGGAVDAMRFEVVSENSGSNARVRSFHTAGMVDQPDTFDGW